MAMINGTSWPPWEVGGGSIWSQERDTYDLGVDRRAVFTVKMPETMHSIGTSGFDGCRNLKSVIISPSVNVIGVNAVRDCVNLETVVALGNIDVISGGAFEVCDSLVRMDLGPTRNSSATAFCGLKTLKVLNCHREEVTMWKWGGLANTNQFRGTFVNSKNIEFFSSPDNVAKVLGGRFAGFERMADLPYNAYAKPYQNQLDLFYWSFEMHMNGRTAKGNNMLAGQIECVKLLLMIASRIRLHTKPWMGGSRSLPCRPNWHIPIPCISSDIMLMILRFCPLGGMRGSVQHA